MTLDAAEMALERCFEYGQLYVAVSRIRSLDGLRLTSFNPNNVKAHPRVLDFYQQLSVYTQRTLPIFQRALAAAPSSKSAVTYSSSSSSSSSSSLSPPSDLAPASQSSSQPSELTPPTPIADNKAALAESSQSSSQSLTTISSSNEVDMEAKRVADALESESLSRVYVLDAPEVHHTVSEYESSSIGQQVIHHATSASSSSSGDRGTNSMKFPGPPPSFINLRSTDFKAPRLLQTNDYHHNGHQYDRMGGIFADVPKFFYQPNDPPATTTAVASNTNANNNNTRAPSTFPTPLNVSSTMVANRYQPSSASTTTSVHRSQSLSSVPSTTSMINNNNNHNNSMMNGNDNVVSGSVSFASARSAMPASRPSASFAMSMNLQPLPLSQQYQSQSQQQPLRRSGSFGQNMTTRTSSSFIGTASTVTNGSASDVSTLSATTTVASTLTADARAAIEEKKRIAIAKLAAAKAAKLAAANANAALTVIHVA
jgi:hypothetical protein